MSVFPGADNLAANCRGNILVVSSASDTVASIEKIIKQIGFVPLAASSQREALDILKKERISYALVDESFTDVSSDKLVRSMRSHVSDRYLPVIILATLCDETQLSLCDAAGSDDFLFQPFSSISLNARISSLEQIQDLKYLYQDSINEQSVAKRILNNALEERSILPEEIGLLSKSKSVFSGDLFLMARHPDGSLNVLLADFTGHGLSAAIGALPVADVFSVMTEKGFELDYILENINKKLYTLLPTSMFMACSALSITNDFQRVKVWNGGMPDIYIRAYGTGCVSQKIKSSHIPLGIDEEILNRFELEVFNISPGDQLILYTDGLTDAVNANDEMFGYEGLDQCLHENSVDTSIFAKLVDTFNGFCGEVNPADDVTLACIPCTDSLMSVRDMSVTKNIKIAARNSDSNWCWHMELRGESLREMNPVPMVISEIHKISGDSASIDKLSSIMSALYQSAIDHEISDNDVYEVDPVENITSKHSEGVSHLFVRIGVKKVVRDGMPALLIQMEGNGKEVTNEKLVKFLDDENECGVNSCVENVPLIYELNKLSSNQSTGNRFEAIVCGHR